MTGERSDVQASAAEVAEALCDPDAVVRRDAVWRGRDLVRRWRGPYGSLIPTLGGRLRDPDPDVRSAAATVFEHLYGVAGPAADDLAERVAHDADLWNLADPVPGRREVRAVAAALAHLGDARAIPSLAANVERHSRLVSTVVLSLRYFRDRAGDFVPSLRRRLARGTRTLPAGYGEALLSVTGLRQVEGAEGLPEVLDLLRTATAAGQWTLVREGLRALAAFGPEAAVADLHPYLASPQPQIAIRAAQVLSASPANARAVLPVVLSHVDAPAPAERDAALEALRRLGPAAEPAAGRLRELLDATRAELDEYRRSVRDWTDDDHRAGRLWHPMVGHAVALWQVTGDLDALLPVLLDAWTPGPHTRTDIVACLADLGPAAALALPLLRGEIATLARRPNGTALTTYLESDETLLVRCRAVLSAAAPT
jgi:hypothetical protein